MQQFACVAAKNWFVKLFWEAVMTVVSIGFSCTASLCTPVAVDSVLVAVSLPLTPLLELLKLLARQTTA
jgi:hypothetical protein